MAAAGREPFRDTVGGLISRHPESGLAALWEQASAVEPDVAPEAFWIRETDDLVNVVWLTHRGLSDLTWLPGRQMSTFNFLRLSSVVGVEMREAPEAAKSSGVVVSGNFIVLVRPAGERAGLLWVAADDPGNVKELRGFAGIVIRSIAQG